MTYKTNQFVAIDTTCKFNKVERHDDGYTISMSCSGEGEDWRDRTVLQVKQNTLLRTVMDRGKKATFTYQRCPF